MTQLDVGQHHHEGSGVDVLLADGRVALIRPVRQTDLEALLELHERASDESVRLRFFTVSRATGRTYVEHLCDPVDPNHLVALVALIGDDILAVASAETIGPETADISFLVADFAHGLGLGTLLLEHLAAAARDRGIRRFSADVLADNWPMLRVFTDAGFDVDKQSDMGVVTLGLDTAATARAVAAADRRECVAEARSLEPLLYPHSVAVVGVRRDGGGVGCAVLDGLRRGGFTGEVYVVHPSATDIGGTPAYPDFGSIGHPVDLVVVAVPAAQVAETIRQAAGAGSRSAVILSSGFGEMGGDGNARQRELVTLARRHSMRLVGPNCLGVMTTDPAFRLNATFTRDLPEPGGLAIASQSGGVGIALLDVARETQLGIASFVSLGNKADVSGNDLLAAWLDDDRVSAAALYLESFGNAQKFARIARRFAERKPLLAVVGGRSDGGRRAGASHTAAAAAPAVGVDALFAQAGVIGCRTLDSIVDTARLLTTQPLPSGPRLGIVGNAGGLGVLAADAATADGLVVPELSTALSAQLTEHVSGTSAVSNPVDLGAGASPAGFLSTVTAMLGSDEVDAVLAVVAGTAVTDSGALLDALVEARAVDVRKPLLLVALGDVSVPPDSASGFARFGSVEDAAEAFAHAARYAAWLAAPAGTHRLEVPGAATRARLLATSALPSPGAPVAAGWLAPGKARDLLDCYGIEAPLGAVATGIDAVVEAAERIGFPVVAKVADPGVVHKTDRGLVRTGLTSPDEVLRAVAAFRTELGTEPAVLVQPQVADGVEVAVGLVRDDSFGPLVMVAAGGIATDVWSDRVFLMPPLTDNDAARAVRSLRIWPLLAGHRGSPGVDVAALERLVLDVGQLALDVPDIAEMDLNPVIMTPAGAACVDVKIRLAAAAGTTDAGVPRRLRTPD
jgi:acyl-CoA synthetase (NDP forming)/GNAT superfamily N-acetyltransferase